MVNCYFREQKKLLAAFFSFFQINLEASSISTTFKCDCSLYNLANFINYDTGRYVIKGSAFSHTLLLSRTNFQSWKCRASKMLQSNITARSFLVMPSELFLCSDESIMCPFQCTCYKRATNKDIVVDCSDTGLNRLPVNIPIPTSGHELIVSLEHNDIVDFEDCTDSQYRWLEHVTRLNLQSNNLSPKNVDSTNNFLNCLKRVTHLYLANNNLRYLPLSIQQHKYTELSIVHNPLICDCTTDWLKPWLQTHNKSIVKSATIHCINESK